MNVRLVAFLVGEFWRRKYAADAAAKIDAPGVLEEKFDLSAYTAGDEWPIDTDTEILLQAAINPNSPHRDRLKAFDAYVASVAWQRKNRPVTIDFARVRRRAADRRRCPEGSGHPEEQNP